MCTKFQVDSFENDVFRAFQRPKMATFHDIPTHYHAFLFFVFIRIFMRRTWLGIGKVIFRAQNDKTTEKHVSCG